MATIAPAPAVTAARENGNGNGNGVRVRVNAPMLTLIGGIVLQIVLGAIAWGSLSQRSSDLDKGQAELRQDLRDLAHRIDRIIESRPATK